MTGVLQRSENMKVLACCSLLLAVLGACSAFQFQRKYRDGVTLYNHAGRTFTVHWDADIDQQTIYFAVNVSTTGWIGFGISPDGGMPRADVVIGWISRDGRQHFRDRYAFSRTMPPIDRQQDWHLTNAGEENGHTMMEFHRLLKTGDTQDLDIPSGPAHVIWAWHEKDPPNDHIISYHSMRGSATVTMVTDDVTAMETTMFTLHTYMYKHTYVCYQLN